MNKEEFFKKIINEVADSTDDQKIENIEIYYAKLKYHKPFVIATDSFEYSTNLIIIVKSGEHYGVGEAPSRELSEGLIKDLEPEIRKFKGSKISEGLQKTLETKSSSISLSFSMAILDLASRIMGKRYGDLLGGPVGDKVETDVTIGIKSLEETLEEYKYYTSIGFKKIKVKLGENIKKDIEKVKKLSEIADSKHAFRFDANQGWNLEEAKEFIGFMNNLDLNVEILEQPLPKDEYEKAGELRKLTDVPIVLDESVRKSEDILKVAKFVDGVNLKPTKAENILEITYGYKLAKELNLVTMIGCSSESNIGITSSAYIASAMDVQFADLDSDILQEPVLKENATDYRDGYRILPVGPGLGIDKDKILFEKIVKLDVL
ncbi:MAG: enolase C-terminal domain-like protein [Candidatus Njordarchaeia archaeon]